MQEEGIQAEEKALRYVAKAGDGSMRDALSLLDQCIAFYLGKTLTYDNVLEVLGTVDHEVFSKLLRQVIRGNVTQCIQILEELLVSGKELGQFVADFTWYLRNLLLLKTSENAEDILDVSSEHLVLLQQESKMVNAETLMRYIRVLSELSSQLRQSTQKRVMVEIGLIKLCRPAMEMNLDSILDRLRVLEDKIENGNFTVAPSGFPSGENHGMLDGFASTPKAVVEEKKPEKAAPWDLQRIRQDWRMIVGQTSGMFKMFLTTAVPKYNGATGENKLYVEFTDDLAERAVADPTKKAFLENVIAQYIGKSVEVEMVLKKDNKTQPLSDISVDDILKQAIHMDVIVEDI